MATQPGSRMAAGLADACAETAASNAANKADFSIGIWPPDRSCHCTGRTAHAKGRLPRRKACRISRQYLYKGLENRRRPRSRRRAGGAAYPKRRERLQLDMRCGKTKIGRAHV